MFSVQWNHQPIHVLCALVKLRIRRKSMPRRASPRLPGDVTLSERNPVELGRQSASWPCIPRQIMKMISQKL
ncbi:hypothetical protein GJAV_G00038810 [Gymnothorax javanicus]|nr:hypothetical protein GJAV_G00038810 [Gymnothorax javanicus]